MPTSVMPYRSSKTFPDVISDHAFFVGVGRAAEPEMFKRRFFCEVACATAAFNSSDSSLCVCRRRW